MNEQICRDCKEPITKHPKFNFLITKFSDEKPMGSQIESFSLCEKCYLFLETELEMTTMDKKDEIDKHIEELSQLAEIAEKKNGLMDKEFLLSEIKRIEEMNRINVDVYKKQEEKLTETKGYVIANTTIINYLTYLLTLTEGK